MLRVLWDRYRYYIIGFFIAGAVLTIWAGWKPKPVDFMDANERIAFITLLVEYIGLGALIIAVLEFSRQLATPELEVWAISGSPGNARTSKDTIEYSNYMTSPFQGGLTRFEFQSEFVLYIRNKGTVPAQFVKLTVEFFESGIIEKGWRVSVARTGLTQNIWEISGIVNKSSLPFIDRLLGKEHYVIHTSENLSGGFDNTDDMTASYRVSAWGFDRNFEQIKRVQLKCTVQSLSTEAKSSTFQFVIPDGLVHG